MIEMTFLTTSLEGFSRWFMMFGDSAKVISPESLKDRVARLCRLITEKNPFPVVPC